MYIRKSAPEDLPRIMEIYAHARAFMTEHGNPRQWAMNGWPPEELIREDIEQGDSYVCVINEDADSESAESTPQDHIIGTFYYTAGPDIEPTYRVIEDGAWLADTPYGVVHRIAADGSVKGTGAYCINWAFGKCGHLRIDTHPDNKVMQGLLTKLGFSYRGIIHVEEDDDPRYAYERI